MRKHFFIGSCFAILFLSACSKDDVKSPNIDGEGIVNIPEIVAFNALKSDFEDSRSLSNFSAGDEISVSAWVGSIEDEENFISKNSIYKCDNNGLFLPATENDTIKWKDSSTPHYFIATYPKRQEISDLRALPITVDDKELLVARYLGENGGAIPNINDTLTLSFKHILSKVNVTINIDDEFEYKDLEDFDLRFEEVSNSGKLDLVTMNLNTDSPTDEIHFDLNPANDIFTGYIVPQTVTKLKLEVKDSGESAYSYDGELVFEAGKIHNLMFELKPRLGLQLTGVTVNDWGNGELTLFEGRNGSWKDNVVKPSTDADGVYLITSPSEFAWVAHNLKTAKSTVKLVNDLNLEAHYWEPASVTGSSTTNIFVIDGNGRSITGLCIDATQTSNKTDIGLIGGTTAKWVLVKDLNIISPVIKGSDKVVRAGVILSKGSAGCGIYNCKVTDAELSGFSNANCEIGGLTADLSNGCAIAGSIFNGTISVDAKVKSIGGLTAFAGKSMMVANIVDCDFDADATNKGLFAARVGAVGTAPDVFNACYYAGAYDVTSLPFAKGYADTHANIVNCSRSKYSVSDISNLNTGINGAKGYNGKNGTAGLVKATCVLLSTKSQYKYNYVENNSNDKDKYPIIVSNVAGK